MIRSILSLYLLIIPSTSYGTNLSFLCINPSDRPLILVFQQILYKLYLRCNQTRFLFLSVIPSSIEATQVIFESWSVSDWNQHLTNYYISGHNKYFILSRYIVQVKQTKIWANLPILKRIDVIMSSF